MSLSELRKDVKFAQYPLEFCCMDLLPINSHSDAYVARTICYNRGLGRVKHVDVCHCWLESEPRDCNSIRMRIDRKFNARLTYSPSAKELRKVSFHVQMPQHDSEDGKLQCCLKRMPAPKIAACRCSEISSREKRDKSHGCGVRKCMHRSSRGRHVKRACLVFDPQFFCCISVCTRTDFFFLLSDVVRALRSVLLVFSGSHVIQHDHCVAIQNHAWTVTRFSD